MLSLVLLVLPLCALAAPSSRPLAHTSTIKRAEDAPFAPATSQQGPFDICSTPSYTPSSNENLAPWSDCLQIRDWARDHKGEWILSSTTNTNDDADWTALHRYGNCALFVKNGASTAVGNKDVADAIDAMHTNNGGDDIGLKGSFDGCHGGVAVDFWLRNSVGL
ncbi:hypothetical protein GGR54DRAFT_638380 [Hypoxylon sp. NC1633]|nr:hypothetical protein GGR54DRAFT_638380 [Hypoxylon sp. NC1633]